MPLYSIKEFAELTGKKAKDLHVYISRGKLIKTEDRRIDPANPLNDLFLQQHSQEKEHTTIIGFDTKQKSLTSSRGSKTDDDNDKHTNSLVELDKQKKKLEIEKLKREVIIKDEDIKKKQGDTIDRNQTINIVKSFSENFKKNICQQIQSHIQEICVYHGVKTDKSAEYKMRVMDIVNACSDKSLTMLSEIDN